MSLIEAQGEQAVHFPAKQDKFEFDAEVSKIFDKMARRSIPNYELAHSMHAALAANHLKDGGSVLDIGASHGEFYHSLFRRYDKLGGMPSNLSLTATDVSPDMCAIMRATLPGVTVYQDDLMENQFLRSTAKYDFINCMYVLQFLPEFAQDLVLTKMCTMLKPGGILSIGQKESKPGEIGDCLQRHYIEFRLENGYTQAEIDAKTQALKNSMWPMTNEEFMHILTRFGMRHIIPVTRSGVFATYIAQR
jgi:tRNA (cmo5U34)-methyltransferase